MAVLTASPTRAPVYRTLHVATGCRFRMVRRLPSLFVEWVAISAGRSVLIVFLADVFQQIVVRRLQFGRERDREGSRIRARILNRDGHGQRIHSWPCISFDRMQLLGVRC